MPRNANQSKQSNYSMDFDGANDYIDTGFIPADKISGNFTISAYVDCGNIGGGIGVDFICGVQNYGTTGKRFGFGVYDNNAPKYYYMFGSLGAISFTISNNPKNGWTHLAVTYDGTNLRFYSNGTLDGTTNVGALSALPTSNMYIGARNKVNPNDDAVDFFDGKMEQVCIFDYALSLSQVTTLYGDSTNGPGNPMALPSSPIAYYPLGTSAWNGNFLAENNAIGDYVFDFIPNDYVQTGGFTIGNNYTFSCWLKSDTTSPSDMCFLSSPNYYTVGYNGNFVIRFTSATQIQMYSYNERSDSESSTVTIPSIDTNWHHFALTSNGTTTNIYWDGSPLTVTGNQTKSLDNISQGLIIGHNITGNNNAFNGEISNVQVFNTALSSTDAETLYNYGSPIQTLANIPQNSNLKAWYKLDATEIYNSTSTEWEVNNALSPWTSSLNLVPNDYIDCGNDSSLSISGDLTLSAWVYLDTTPNSYMSIFSKMSSTSRNYTLYARNNRKFSITTQASGGVVEFTTSNTAIPLKTWTHIVVTFDSGVNNGTKYYFNGVQDAITGTHNVVADTSNLNIGKRTTSTQYLDGKISNAQIFNTALSGTEVETLYNSGNPLTDMSSFSSLVSWWKLNNTTTGIEDSKGSNDGTNNGATEAPGSVSTLNGLSSGMSQANLVQSDLQTVAPYSKYAMDFDGTDYIETLNNGPNITQVTLSAWIKRSGTQSNYNGVLGVRNTGGAPHYGISWDLAFQSSPSSTNKIQFRVGDGTNAYKLINSNSAIPDNTWIHVVGVLSGTNVLLYINGALQTETETFTGTLLSPNSKIFIGSQGPSGGNGFVGFISNPAVWNTGLSTSEVVEIYNEGLPSDLNTFSGTAPIAWWQLGENSSFNGNDWIVADEIGSSNGESDGMGVDALTNGVGTTANGVSSGMSEGSLVGDAPYSTANAISSGMAVTARGTDVP